MTDKERKYLSDILNSIAHIEEFTKELTSFTDFSSNFLVKSAVERHFIIIGEAVAKYSRISEHPLSSAQEIISLRHHLVHGYDSIDDRIIWSIVQRHIAPLKIEATNAINLP